MRSPKAPEPPDPYDTASAQTGQNIGTAIGNQLLGQVNQNTPYGSLRYEQTGNTSWTDPSSGKTYDIPRFTSTTTLSPQQKGLLDAQMRAQTGLADFAGDQTERLGSIFGKQGAIKAPNLVGLQPGSAPNLREGFADSGKITKSYNTDFSADRQRVEDALMARLNPQLEQDRTARETALANKGIKLGSASYDRGMDEFTRQSNDARLGAILGAGQEQSRLVGLEADRAQFQNLAQQQQFGQDYTRAGFGNDARQQEFQNRLAAGGFNNNVRQQNFGNEITARNQPINEIAALLGTGQVTNPVFGNGGTGGSMPFTDLAGLIQSDYQNQLGDYQRKLDSHNNMMGGLFSLGQAAIMASDRRLKADIEQIGEWKGLPLYAYRYIWGRVRRIGVMAQDVLKVRPDAIVPMGGGFMAVDYARL